MLPESLRRLISSNFLGNRRHQQLTACHYAEQKAAPFHTKEQRGDCRRRALYPTELRGQWRRLTVDQRQKLPLRHRIVRADSSPIEWWTVNFPKKFARHTVRS